MKRFFALLLAVSLCLSAAVFSVSAEEISQEDFEAAIIETAMAYYNKGLPIQYDSNPWTIQNKNDWGGACRLTSGAAPEEGSMDNTIYSVCSDWCYDIYYNAFGYELMGAPRRCLTYNMLALPATDPLVVCKYRPLGDDPDAMTDIDEAVAAARDALQVGDIIIGRGTSDGVNYNGHTMLYIGDYKGDGEEYVIHCWGGKFNTTTGADKLETGLTNANPEGGSIRIHKVTEVFSDPGTTAGVWNVRRDAAGKAGFIVLRPAATEEFRSCSLTPSARVRLAYRGLEVAKETGVSHYACVRRGDELTLIDRITNNGTEDYTGLTVTEPLPTGARLKDADGGTEADGALTWTVDVPAGETREVSFTVTVTARRGGFVSFGCGAVGGDLPTRATKIPVGGRKLPSSATSAATRLRNGTSGIVPSQYIWTNDPVETVNKIYRDVLGLPLELPTDLSAYMEGLCEQQTVGGVSETYGGWMWVPKTEVEGDWQRVKEMIVPDHLVGSVVYLDGSPDTPRDNWSATNRVQEYKKLSYEVGDIFLALDLPDKQTLTDQHNVLAYVYLSGGKVACVDAASGVRIDSFDNTVACLYNKSFVVCLRPTLAYDDIGKGVRSILPGDLTGDGALGMKDMLHLRQHLAGGYGVEADPLAADLDCDNDVNMRDLLTLRQYFAGGYGIVLE